MDLSFASDLVDENILQRGPSPLLVGSNRCHVGRTDSFGSLTRGYAAGLQYVEKCEEKMFDSLLLAWQRRRILICVLVGISLLLSQQKNVYARMVEACVAVKIPEPVQ